MSVLTQLHMDISWQLQRIANQLPEDYKLTLVARNTQNAGAGIVLTDDDLDLAAAEILKLKERPPIP